LKELILHIGMEKTGSTSIQSCLESNKELLQQHGILYPDVGKVSAHHYEIAHLKQDPAVVSDALESESENYDKVILSSEHFSRASSDTQIGEYREVLRNFDTTVICYLRDPLSWLVSLFGEHIKWGGRATIDDFFRRSNWKFNYALLLDRWSSIFGAESFHCFNYGCYDNVVEHFVAMSVGELNLDMAYSSNRSDSTAFLEIVRRLNTAFPEIDTRSLLEQLRDQIENRSISLPEYSWQIRPVIVDTLSKQRDLFNSRLGRDFFENHTYQATAPGPNQEKCIASAMLKLMDRT